MGSLSVDGGLATTRITTSPDQTVIDQRMRALLSTIACEMFDVPVPDRIDGTTVIPQTPASRAAKRWRDDMCAILGLTPIATAAVSAPAAPAADPSGQPRVITRIRRDDDGDGSWRRHGACRDEDPELFQPIGDGPASQAQAELAKTVCHRCPVVAKCRTWALTKRVEHGVMGGMTESERRAYWDAENTRAAA